MPTRVCVLNQIVGFGSRSKHPVRNAKEPLQGLLAVVVPLRFHSRAAHLHSAPSSRAVLRRVEEEPPAFRTGFHDTRGIGGQQRDGCVGETPTDHIQSCIVHRDCAHDLSAHVFQPRGFGRPRRLPRDEVQVGGGRRPRGDDGVNHSRQSTAQPLQLPYNGGCRSAGKPPRFGQACSCADHFFGDGRRFRRTEGTS
jgi:hypothetical protein